MPAADAAAATVTRRVLPRPALLRYLDALPAPGGGACTVHIAPGEALPDLAPLHPALTEAAARIAAAVDAAGVGAALFWDGHTLRAVIPPLPLPAAGRAPGVDAEPLRALLAAETVIGVCLVRLGRYGIGVYRNETLVASKTDRRFVHGRNRKGGSSSNRFRRIREEQAHNLYKDVCAALQAHVGPWLGAVEHFFWGGEAQTLAGFRAWCPWAAQLAPVERRRTLDVREPGQRALQELPRTLWETVVYEVTPAP